MASSTCELFVWCVARGRLKLVRRGRFSMPNPFSLVCEGGGREWGARQSTNVSVSRLINARDVDGSRTYHAVEDLVGGPILVSERDIGHC
jgi:hypothetical protein